MQQEKEQYYLSKVTEILIFFIKQSEHLGLESYCRLSTTGQSTFPECKLCVKYLQMQVITVSVRLFV